MNSQRRRPGPPDTTVVGRAGSQICRLSGIEHARLVRGSRRRSASRRRSRGRRWSRRAEMRTVLLAPSQPTTYRARTDAAASRVDEPVLAVELDRHVMDRDVVVVLFDAADTDAAAHLERGQRSARRSRSASSAGWLNIDEKGQPDSAVADAPEAQQRRALLRCATRRSRPAREMARTSSPMPHDWRMRPTSWSKCTARGSG